MVVIYQLQGVDIFQSLNSGAWMARREYVFFQLYIDCLPVVFQGLALHSLFSEQLTEHREVTEHWGKRIAQVE